MKEGEEAKACAAEIQKSEAGDTAGLESCTPEQIQDLDCPSLFLNRELNWLEFNGRVLECALDDEAPLLEQLKFLTIFYTNLDEFFMVRVANVFRLYRSGSQPTGDDKMSAARQLAEIRRRVMHMTSIAQEHWRKKLSGKLRDKGISIVHFNELSEKQRRFLSTYFNNEIYPTLTPQAIDPTHPFPTISNVSLNFIIQLRDEKGEVKFARLRAPAMSRVLFLFQNRRKRAVISLACHRAQRTLIFCLWKSWYRNTCRLCSRGTPSRTWGSSASPVIRTWKLKRTRPMICLKP